jgi:glycosyltransferase involved in cell wall biosynthesis
MEVRKRREGGRRLSGRSHVEAPLVTILIVVLRVEDELRHILQNVFEHDEEYFEVVIIDGGSGQATLDVLEEWNDRIDLWISEPDHGVYDAMNKGAALAAGHFLYHLNAGDRLAYLPIPELIEARHQKVDALSFPVMVDHSRVFRPSCGLLLRFKNTMHHQGTFYRREALPKFDLSYPILADFDVNQRLLLGGAKIRCFRTVVAHHASGGICDLPEADREYEQIIVANYGRPYVFGHWLLSEWSGIRIRNTERLRNMFFRRPVLRPDNDGAIQCAEMIDRASRK